MAISDDDFLGRMFGEDEVTRTRALIDQYREEAKALIVLAYSAENETDRVKRVLAALPLAAKAKRALGEDVPASAFELFFTVIKCAGEIATELHRATGELADVKAALEALEGQR